MPSNILSDRSLRSELARAQAQASQKSTRVKIRDGNNLMLVVRANGSASWVLEYRNGVGKRKPHTLGPWPAMGLAAARQAAQDSRALLVGGKDLNTHRREVKVAAVQKAVAESDSVKKLFEDFMSKQATSDVYLKNIRAAFVADVLPEIGAMHPHEVTREDFLKILRKIEKRGSHVMVRRVRMWLKHVFEYGIDDETRAELTTLQVPTGHMRSFMPIDPGNFPAVTDPIEAGELMVAIGKFRPYVTRTYLTLAAHLFQRPTELLTATWEQFNLEKAVWVMPANVTKKEREHWVPLSPIVIDMLKKHQGVVGDEGFLFPGRDHAKPICLGTAEKAIHAIGYKGRHCPHGFRAMARTIGEERLGIDEKFLEKQLSHEEQDKVKRAYNRSQFWLDRVALMQRWSQFLVDATAKSASESKP